MSKKTTKIDRSDRYYEPVIEKPSKSISIKDIISEDFNSIKTEDKINKMSFKDQMKYDNSEKTDATSDWWYGNPRRTKAPVNDFFEQYKDPRWQKKRLKVMQRDNFMCISCQSVENTLNVHHKVPYRKETKPWEYEDDELITLCENCHKSITEIINTCKSIIMCRCWSVYSAQEVQRIMEEIDGMNPYQLEATWKIIKECKKL